MTVRMMQRTAARSRWMAAGVHVAAHRVRAATLRRAREDRGDVPGWVMVTLMTAGLVTVLWLLAEDQLQTLFQEALDNVRGH